MLLEDSAVIQRDEGALVAFKVTVCPLGKPWARQEFPWNIPEFISMSSGTRTGLEGEGFLSSQKHKNLVKPLLSF